MDQFQKEFIGLIQSAFTEKQIALSSDFDWEKAIDLAKKHSIAPIVYYGAANSHVPADCAPMQALFLLTCKILMVSQRQMREIEKIITAFETEGIDYMPLKGTILKTIYPKPEMRTMGDADILIKLAQYDKIESIMKRLGFAFQGETDHELVWKNPSLFLELHKRVMTSYNKEFYGYLGSGWERAKNAGGHRYEVSAEDFYIYLFVHFTKHYRISGIGIKHLLDLWVYAEAFPNLDRAYISRELQKMHLREFYENVLDTINAWFSNGPETEKTDLITNVIFQSGQYGTADMATVNRAIRDSKGSALHVKLTKIVRSLFLPYPDMKRKYPVLEKLPFLLPVMWIVRWFKVLFLQKGLLKHYVEEIGRIDTQSVEENRNALHFVGLDFYEE